MDVQLKELIEKIKSEGVKTAEEKADEIIRNAEKKAENIIREADDKAREIRSKAKADAERFESTTKEALKQAGRDTILSTSKKLEKIFNSLLKSSVDKVLDGSFLESVILTVVKNWKEDTKDMTVLLPESEMGKLESSLKASLAKEISEGMDINPLSGIDSGFRVTSRDGAAYFDFTGDGITGILSALLNPRIAELIQDAADREE